MGAACDQNDPTNEDRSQKTEKTEALKDTLVITIGGKEFTATLVDNSSATAFTSILPLTITMTDLNGNEKYFRLPNKLPTNESNPGTINSGDLMLYDSNTLVLFYEGFRTSYSYTRLGRITNSNGLTEALGNGNVVVTLDLK